ncbi:MAG: hypothetical protein WBD71_15910, partial [Xanthobacteraceae bacterium]
MFARTGGAYRRASRRNSRSFASGDGGGGGEGGVNNFAKPLCSSGEAEIFATWRGRTMIRAAAPASAKLVTRSDAGLGRVTIAL